MNIATTFKNDKADEQTARPAFMRDGSEPFLEMEKSFGDLQEVLSDVECLSGAESAREIQKMRKELESFLQEVTFIGQIKAGKTTLVNAMAGRPGLLPSDVNPWTSVVTSLHMDTQRGADGGAEFSFFDEEEWNRLVSSAGRLGEVSQRVGAEDEHDRLIEQANKMRQLSQARLGSSFEKLLGQRHRYSEFDNDVIRRYVCLGDAFDGEDDDDRQGQYADITKTADIYLPMDFLPSSLILRDTPGLNDTFLMREQVTIRAIRNSRICVVVLSAQQAMNSVDLGLIRLISSIKSRQVVIFVNRIDELHDPGIQLSEVKAGLLKTLEEHNGPENPTIIFGSAMWATAALNDDVADLPANSGRALRAYLDVTDELVSPRECWNASGVPDLYECIGQRIQHGPGEKLINGIRKRANNIVLGLVASNKVVGLVANSNEILKLSDDRVVSRIAQVEAFARKALEQALTNTFNKFGSRIDRAHISFLNRAVDALLHHLESFGEGEAWNYSPDGLRVLARSAYRALTVSLKKEVDTVFSQVAEELVSAYGDIFDVNAENFSIQVPEIPDLPPPVTIAKTIILDVNTPWWKTWSRNRRGYDALASDFRELIADETDSILNDLKLVQLEEIRKTMNETLQQFLMEQQSILADVLTQSRISVEDLNKLFGVNQMEAREGVLEMLVEELQVDVSVANETDIDDD